MFEDSFDVLGSFELFTDFIVNLSTKYCPNMSNNYKKGNIFRICKFFLKSTIDVENLKQITINFKLNLTTFF